MAKPTDRSVSKSLIYRQIGITILVAMIWFGISFCIFDWISANNPEWDKQYIFDVTLIVGEFIVIPLAFATSWLLPRFDCSNCRGSIASGRTWVCGKCRNINRPAGVWSGSVLMRCGDCKSKPELLKCPHCDAVIEMVHDPDQRYTASFYEWPAISPKKAAKLRRWHQRAIEEAIGPHMNEIYSSLNLGSALTEFKRLKTEEIKNNPYLSEADKEDQLGLVDDVIQETKAKHL